jgi:hypothetical protein
MHALSAHAWDYLPALQTVFESVGLDYLYHVNDFSKERFNAFMGQFSSTKLRNEIMSKSSLRDYITFHRHKGKQPYLEDMRDFEGYRLKPLCRTNSLCLNNLLSKMSLKNSNKCSLCDCNVVEDLCHFLLLCPALEQIRKPLLNDISFNTVELDFVDLPNYIKIKLLIGDCGFYINEIEGMYLDVIGRHLLKKLYHERNIILEQSNVL